MLFVNQYLNSGLCNTECRGNQITSQKTCDNQISSPAYPGGLETTRKNLVKSFFETSSCHLVHTVAWTPKPHLCVLHYTHHLKFTHTLDRRTIFTKIN